MKFDYKKILIRKQKWIEDSFNKQMLWDDSMSKITDALSNIDLASAGLVAGRLNSCSTYLSNHGCVLIADGDATGWQKLRLAEDYRYWSSRIFTKRWEATGSEEGCLPVTVFTAPLVLFGAITYGENGRVAWLSPWLERQLTSGYYAHLDKRTVGSLAVALGKAMTGGGTLPAEQSALLGPYTDIFASWHNTEQLGEAIRKACDFHISRTGETKNDLGEFASTPHNIFPTEYLALRQVRKAQGLATPKPKHPLLDTPFSDPPDPLPTIEDDLLNRAITAVRQILPDL